MTSRKSVPPVEKMRKPARQERILALLSANPALRVNQLAENLNVSVETIRRDLTDLTEVGQISRTYGGAVRSQRFEPQLSERLALHVSERQRIAQIAVEQVGDADAVLIGGGATVLHFARALVALDRPLTVITMSHSIAPELAVNPQFQIMLLPGFYDGREGIVTGADTIAALARFHAPVAVLGASGVDTSGMSEAMLAAAQVYAAIVDYSDRQLIVADHSKFARRALALVSPWRTGMTLCTDSTPDPEIMTAIERGGARIALD